MPSESAEINTEKVSLEGMYYLRPIISLQRGGRFA
jgi:hypothetical protein